MPLAGQVPFIVLQTSEVFSNDKELELMHQMADMAKYVFLVLEKAWQILGRRLVDFKVEFGKNQAGELLLADVIDNDSWRVLEDGRYLDKQGYRDGEGVSDVLLKYRKVEELTRRFHLPTQAIILWTGSPKDDLKPFQRALDEISAKRPLVNMSSKFTSPGRFTFTEISASLHKETVEAVGRLNRAVQENPDSVIIAYIGRSNGAGPALSANTTVPVISVPANWKEFPEDVWSSLRTPSNVPTSVILESANAVLHARQILAMRNPELYATLRFEQEKRLTNVIPV